MIFKDGQRGQAVLRGASTGSPTPIIRCSPTPATGSTEVAIIRPAPGRATAAGRLPVPPTPDCPAASWSPSRSARTAGGATPACWPPATTPSWRAWTPTTPAACCCWSGTSPAAQRARAARHRAPASTAHVPGTARAVVVAAPLLSRDGAPRCLSVEGPVGPRELWRLDTATLRLDPGRPPVPALPDAGAGRADAGALLRPRRAAADRLAVPARPASRAGPGDAEPARRPGGPGATGLLTRSTRPWPPPGSPCSRPTSAAPPGSAGPSCTPTTCTAAGTPSTTSSPARDYLVRLGHRRPGPDRGHRPLVRRLPDAGRAGLLSRACSPPASTSAACRTCTPSTATPSRGSPPPRYSKYGDPERRPQRCSRPSRRCARPTTSTSRCWSCTASSTPTCRSARRTRSSPRCASSAGRWSTCELAGEGHEYRRADSRRTLVERIRDFLVAHV